MMSHAGPSILLHSILDPVTGFRIAVRHLSDDSWTLHQTVGINAFRKQFDRLTV